MTYNCFKRLLIKNIKHYCIKWKEKNDKPNNSSLGLTARTYTSSSSVKFKYIHTHITLLCVVQSGKNIWTISYFCLRWYKRISFFLFFYLETYAKVQRCMTYEIYDRNKGGSRNRVPDALVRVPPRAGTPAPSAALAAPSHRPTPSLKQKY